MNPTEDRPVSTPLLVGIYAASFVGMAVLWNLLNLIASFDNPAMGLIVVFAAAGVAAQYWFSREKVVPPSGRIWTISLICGVVSAILSTGLFAVGMSADAQLAREFSQAGIVAIVGVFAAIVVIHALMARLGFWLTFWQAAKKAAGKR